jgi:hypothetical protein
VAFALVSEAGVDDRGGKGKDRGGKVPIPEPDPPRLFLMDPGVGRAILDEELLPELALSGTGSGKSLGEVENAGSPLVYSPRPALLIVPVECWSEVSSRCESFEVVITLGLGLFDL